MSQGTGTGRRNGPPGSLGPPPGCSGSREVRGSGRNCCSAPDGVKKKEKKKIITGKNTSRGSDALRCLQKAERYFIFAANTTRAFNVYFHSHPHVLFRKSEYTHTHTHKNCVSNFSQIVSKRTLIPSQPDSTLYPCHLYLLAEKCGMFSKDFSRVFSRVGDPDQGQRSVAINKYE